MPHLFYFIFKSSHFGQGLAFCSKPFNVWNSNPFLEKGPFQNQMWTLVKIPPGQNCLERSLFSLAQNCGL